MTVALHAALRCARSMHSAASELHKDGVELAKELLALRADPSRTDESGAEPLWQAVRLPIPAMRTLLTAGRAWNVVRRFAFLNILEQG